MRGAGCTFNDIVDRDFDRSVDRTRNRPLAAGAVGLAGAILWMIAQALIGLCILLLLNRTSLVVGALSLPLIAIYPFMKRVTWWPQVFLGLAFNWGALLGFVAVTGHLAPAPIVLYLGGIAWTLGYDTIYAHQDKEDDALIGVRSSARRLGPQTRPFLFAVYAAAYAEIAAAGRLGGLGWGFLLLLIPAALHLLWQAATVKTENAADCLRKFRANRDFGLLVLAAFLIAPLI
jgi:4-hydroxybenzoate polyprenyltransferase